MKRDIAPGFVDYTTLVFIPDPASTDGSGKTGLVAANLTVSYARVETDNDVTVTDVTGSLNNLAALTTAHTDWGLLEVSSTLAPGLYRLDVADAVFAAGAWTAVVYVMITTSAAAASPMEFNLVDLTADIVAQVATAAELVTAIDDTSMKLQDIADASDEAAGKMQGVVLLNTLIGSTGNDTTHIHLPGVASANDLVNDLLLTIKDDSTDLFYSRWIEDFVFATELATVATLPFTPEASVDEFWLLSIRRDVTGTSGLDAAGVRAAIGLGAADLDTQLGDINTAAEDADNKITALVFSGIAFIGATGNDTTHLHLPDFSNYADDSINDLLLTILDVSTGLFYSRWIEDFTTTGDLATVALLPFTPQASADRFWITAIRRDVTGTAGLDAAGVRAAVGLASANIDTQLAAKALETTAQSILTDTAVIGSAGAGLTAVPWNASWDAEVESEALDALNTILADSIPADGTLPTLRQAIYMGLQFLLERDASGAPTVLVKKVDGTTTLFTLTLSDPAQPLSITRAT